ncbi:MAG: hypothetical protein Q4F65_08855 [Propionibacteriaceae bacterium]|nr:hypothetical protein [Propionibacteriaceae bacterium]
MSDLIRAVTPIDRLDHDGRTLLLLPDQVIELSLLAQTAYDAASEPITLDALTDLLVAEFGAPPEGDPRDGVQAVVDELAQIGLVERATSQQSH